MAAAVEREIKITYGSITVGGTTDRLIDGKVRLRRSYDAFALSFSFVTSVDESATAEAEFAAECAMLEAAFRTPRQDVTVSYGATTHLSIADGTGGYGIASEIEKAASDDADTGRSRRYNVTITGKLPADLAGKNYRRDLSWECEWSESRRRRVTISGVYTTNPTRGAYAQYEADAEVRSQAILTALTGTFERTRRIAKVDDDDDECVWTHVYQEVIYNQSIGTLDDDEIVGQVLVIDKQRVAPGDSDGAKRLVTISLAYTAFLDRDRTTDLVGKWTVKILPWLKQVLASFAATSTYALVEVTPSFRPDDNSITARLVARATGGSKIVALRVTTEDSLDDGKIPRKLWRGLGSAMSYKAPEALVFKGPATIQRSVTVTMTRVGHVDTPGPGTDPGGAFLGGFGIGQGGFGIGQGLEFTQEDSDNDGEDGGEDAGGGLQGGATSWVHLHRRFGFTNYYEGEEPNRLALSDSVQVDTYELLLGAVVSATGPGGGEGSGGAGETKIRGQAGGDV